MFHISVVFKMNSDVSFFDAAINDLTVFQLHSSNDLIFNISTASSSLTLNETSSQSTYDVYEHLTNIIVYKYVCLTIFVVGVVGNLLSVLVFSRASLRRRSCAVYFLALAITDIASLCASFIDTVLPSYNNFTLTIKFRFLCKMNPLMIYFTTDLSNFLLAIASIDRAISIQFPQRSKEFCRAKIAISTIMIMSIVLLLKNGHIFWGFEIVGEQNQRSCAPSKDKVVFHRNPNPMTYNLFYSIFDSLDMLFAVVIPFFVMLICNIIIIVRVITSRRSITTIITTTQSKKHRKRHEKDRQLTVMLLGSAAGTSFDSFPLIFELVKRNSISSSYFFSLSSFHATNRNQRYSSCFPSIRKFCNSRCNSSDHSHFHRHGTIQSCYSLLHIHIDWRSFS